MKFSKTFITMIFLVDLTSIILEGAVAIDYVDGKFTDIVRGVNYSPHMPGEDCTEFGKADYEQDFRWMKEANINIIRTYDEVPEEVLDAATKFGIKVIDGIWITTTGDFSDPSFLETCKAHIAEIILRDKDKSCIIGWCIGNELSEGAVFGAGVNKTEAFLKALYDYAKSLDPNPNHFVTHANWPPVENLDLSFFDVISFNLYSYWPPNVVQTGYREYLDYLKKMYPDKPFVITEFGYSTSPIGPGNLGYGGNSEEEQAIALQERWKDIIDADCAGGLVFEWNEEWWKNTCPGGDKNTHEEDDAEEWFGIIAVEGTLDNYTLRRKPAYYAVKEMFTSACIRGDVNKDGEINFDDAILVLQICSELPIGDPSHEPTPEELCAADFNKDGEVNVADATQILRFDTGLPVSVNPAPQKLTK